MRKTSLSENQALAAPGARLNWRPGSIARFESLWSILQKLVYLNDIKVKELAFLLNPSQFWRAESGKPVGVSLLDFRSVSRRRLQWLLGLGTGTLNYAVVAPYVLPLASRFSADTVTGVLRFCRVCLERGFHSPLFQELSIVACPVHHVPLEEKCWHCHTEIPYELNNATGNNPYGCPKCQALLWPGMRKAVWQPGMNEEESRSIERYVTWRSDLANGPDVHLWHVAVGESRINTKVFGYIHSLQPLPGWEACWRRDTEEVRGTVTSGPGIPRVPVSLDKSRLRRQTPFGDFFRGLCTHEALEPVTRDYYAIYKSVRRHVKRRFLGAHRRCRLLANTLGIEHREACSWVHAYWLWRCEWEGRSAFAAERFGHWCEALRRDSQYVRDLMSMVDPHCHRSEESRQVWGWIGGRRLVARLLVSFYEHLCDCGAIRSNSDPIADPCLHWQPATESRGHVLTWWGIPVLDRIDSNMPRKKEHRPDIGKHRAEIAKAGECAKRFGPWF